MIKSSNETMGSYVFTIDKFCVSAGIDEDNSYDENVVNEVNYFQERYDDYLSEEDQIELLQQKEFINSLFYKRYCFNEDMIVMSEDDEFDNEILFLLNDQVKSDGQITEVMTEMEDQNSILMEDEEVVTAEKLTCDRKEDSEDSMKFFSYELSVLEQRTETQRKGVQIVKAEMNEDEEFHFYELEKRDILEEDDVEERLTDSLKDWNQHIDVLMEKKRNLGQHTEMLAEEGKELRPYGFCFNKCFVNADFVDAEGKLTPLGSQLKEEENSV